MPTKKPNKISRTRRGASFVVRRIANRNPRGLLRQIRRRQFARGFGVFAIAAILFGSIFAFSNPNQLGSALKSDANDAILIGGAAAGITALTGGDSTDIAAAGSIGAAVGSLAGSTDTNSGQSTTGVGSVLGEVVSDIQISGHGDGWWFDVGDGPALNGPGAAEGLEEFKFTYRGNKYGSAIGMITGWTNFVLPFISVLAVAALVYAGFLYITAAGNDEQVSKAKNILMWVAIGIVLIFSAYSIVNTLISGDSST